MPNAKSFQPDISFAPEKLWQPILPWTVSLHGAQIGFFNLNLGQTPHPEAEKAVLADVGSYGRQIGRLGDALEVLLNHLKIEGLSEAEEDKLTILRGQLALVAEVKQRAMTRARGSS
jgi:hypothetical protein